MAGRRVVVVPGNHDHRLAEPLLERHAVEDRAIGLEQREGARGETAKCVAGWLGRTEMEIAYPGVWLREDVYATHGHYMDCHRHLPRLECIAAAAGVRAYGGLPHPSTPDDYERVLWPVYGLGFGLAQARISANILRCSERMWSVLTTESGGSNWVTRGILKAGLPVAIAGLNAALRAQFLNNLSVDLISSSGVAAAVEMIGLLDVGAKYVITGHTHRPGPGPEDGCWPLTNGMTLFNTGSWISTTAFERDRDSDRFRPGTITWVEHEGPPRQVSLLAPKKLLSC